MYYILLCLSRYHGGRVDGDFAARLARGADIPNADVDGLSDTMYSEA